MSDIIKGNIGFSFIINYFQALMTLLSICIPTLCRFTSWTWILRGSTNVGSLICDAEKSLFISLRLFCCGTFVLRRWLKSIIIYHIIETTVKRITRALFCCVRNLFFSFHCIFGVLFFCDDYVLIKHLIVLNVGNIYLILVITICCNSCPN